MSTELSTYVATDLDQVETDGRELDKQREERKRRDSQFKTQKGRNLIRIMPPRADYGAPTPFHSLFVHYVPNPNAPQAGGKPFACPAKNANRPCIVCQQVQLMRRSGNAVDAEVAKRLAAKQEWYCNMVDMQNPDKGVQVFKFGITIYERLRKIMKKPNDEDPIAVGDVTHPDTGYSIIIDKAVGDDKNPKETTRYDVNAAKKPSPMANKTWLNQLHDLKTAALDSISPQRAADIMSGKEEAADYTPPQDAPPPSVSDDLYDK